MSGPCSFFKGSIAFCQPLVRTGRKPYNFPRERRKGGATMADLKTQLRELSVAASLGLLIRSLPSKVEALY